jgi:CRP-like cAMP-binding protein
MSLEDDIRSLAAAPILGALSPEALRLIAFTSRKERLTDGTILHRRGETLNGALALLAGEIELASYDGAGRRLRAPAAIGELALFTPVEAGATARAIGEATVMRIARETMTRVFEEFPQEAEGARARVADQLARFAQDVAAADPKS